MPQRFVPGTDQRTIEPCAASMVEAGASAARAVVGAAPKTKAQAPSAVGRKECFKTVIALALLEGDARADPTLVSVASNLRARGLGRRRRGYTMAEGLIRSGILEAADCRRGLRGSKGVCGSRFALQVMSPVRPVGASRSSSLLELAGACRKERS